MNSVPNTSEHPILATCPGTLDMDEATLRKLTRAKLQKLAKENKIKANMKSETIIQELLKLCKVVRPLQDEGSEETPRKKLRLSVQDQPPSGPTRGACEEIPPVAGASTQIMDVPVDTNLDHPAAQEGSQKSALRREESAPTAAARDTANIAAVISAEMLQGPSPLLENTGHPAPDDDTSDADSYLSYADQHSSPCSSRSGTPPAETPQMLNRSVMVMNHITSDDQRILAQAAALRKRAKMLREQAKNVRDIVRAEQGRRERLEAYFTYWREIPPTWPREWIYGDEEEEE
ncbi:uncharacterized protein EDB93DRAFT_1101455 [Suillus bovinus]|uniref:uncharacterized protein n=1 Tax=Suillus bovinus TaxID=48563 RepID=UPI001B85D362|nr:uncharacterized protein EDB93DRAFT_1101455 [Suillus bovinus]KAG2156580.1 hypothetical protein EDB93DRAFT_1101455 [Suillus bovinus]